MFITGILIFAMLVLIFIVLVFNSVQLFLNGEILMSVDNQTAELQAATQDLTEAVAAEHAQVAQAISTLNDKIADLEAIVNTQPDIDLSAEIAAVRNAADSVRAIYEPPTDDSSPVPITADPVADDTEATEEPDDLDTSDPETPAESGE